MPCPSVDISDQTLDAIGVWTARVLKVVVLVGSVVSMAGFLALIFATVSPPTSNEPEPPYEGSPFESRLVPQDPLAPDDPGAGAPISTDALWITEWDSQPDEYCVERSTGIRVRCKNTNALVLTVSMPSESDKWPSWDCRLCQLTCGGCPVVDQCTNETMQIAGCDCVLGCPCGSNTDPAEAVFCSATEPKEWPQPPDAEHLKGEFKFFAVLSDVGFLLFAAVAFLAELNISKLAGMAPVINHWPIKCVIQLFVGVQLINNAGNVATVGDTYNHDAHHIALAGGWMLVFAGLTNVAFHAIFIRPYRAFKLCGLCCMLVVMILVPIGAALGTTADGSDSS